MKPRFLIWSPPYTPICGGIVALHKLCHDINILGYEAYLLSHSKNDKWLGNLVRNGQINVKDKDLFVIYPEIVGHNSLGAKNAVHWVLNSTPAPYPPEDLVFKYAEYFEVANGVRVDGELRSFDMDLDFWTRDLNRNRVGQCSASNQTRNQPSIIGGK